MSELIMNKLDTIINIIIISMGKECISRSGKKYKIGFILLTNLILL